MRDGIGLVVVIAALFASAMPAAAQDNRPLKPILPEGWAGDGDYPLNALDIGAFGISSFRLDVDETGAVTRCRILASSGYAVLDEATCSKLPRRARFKPALVRGKPVPSTYQSKITWIPPGADTMRYKKLLRLIQPFGLILEVNKLPAGYKQGPLLRMVYDPSGKPIACHVEIESGNDEADKVACVQAREEPLSTEGRKMVYPRPDTRMVAINFRVRK